MPSYEIKYIKLTCSSDTGIGIVNLSETPRISHSQSLTSTTLSSILRIPTTTNQLLRNIDRLLSSCNIEISSSVGRYDLSSVGN